MTEMLLCRRDLLFCTSSQLDQELMRARRCVGTSRSSTPICPLTCRSWRAVRHRPHTAPRPGHDVKRPSWPPNAASRPIFGVGGIRGQHCMDVDGRPWHRTPSAQRASLGCHHGAAALVVSPVSEDKAEQLAEEWRMVAQGADRCPRHQPASTVSREPVASSPVPPQTSRQASKTRASYASVGDWLADALEGRQTAGQRYRATAPRQQKRKNRSQAAAQSLSRLRRGPWEGSPGPTPGRDELASCLAGHIWMARHVAS